MRIPKKRQMDNALANLGMKKVEMVNARGNVGWVIGMDISVWIVVWGCMEDKVI